MSNEYNLSGQQAIDILKNAHGDGMGEGWDEWNGVVPADQAGNLLGWMLSEEGFAWRKQFIKDYQAVQNKQN